MFYLLRKVAVLGLGRHFQALPPDVEQPAVIGATNSTVFDFAVLQRSASMRAMKSQQTELSIGITKEHKLFAQDFESLRYVVEVAIDADRNPVTAEPFSRRCARPNVRNIRKSNLIGVLFGSSRHLIPQLVDLQFKF